MKSASGKASFADIDLEELDQKIVLTTQNGLPIAKKP